VVALVDEGEVQNIKENLNKTFYNKITNNENVFDVIPGNGAALFTF